MLFHTVFTFLRTQWFIIFLGSEINGAFSSISQILSYAALVEGGLGTACIISYFEPLAARDQERTAQVFFESKRFFRKVGSIYSALVLVTAVVYSLLVESEIGKIQLLFLTLGIGSVSCIDYFWLQKYQCLFIADQKNRISQLIILSGECIDIAILAVLLFLFDFKNIIMVQVISIFCMLIRLILSRGYFEKKYHYRQSLVTNTSSEGVIKQKKAVFIHVLAQQISFSTDLVLLTIFRTLSEVSIYAVYNMIFNFLSVLVGTISNGVSSSFANLYFEDKKQFAAKFATYELISMMTNCILVISVIAVLPGFIGLYTAGSDILYWSYIVAVLFSLISVLNNIRSPYATIIKAAGKYEETKFIFLGEAAINFAISIILVPKYGIAGVLAGTLFSAIIRNVFVIGYVYKRVLAAPLSGFFRLLIPNFCIVIVVLFPAVKKIMFTNYFGFLLWGCISVFVAFVLITLINLLFNHARTKDMYIWLKQSVRRYIAKNG